MSAQWLPLPFPRCPDCNRAWVRCYHQGCPRSGEVLVEASQRRAKCNGCVIEWPLMRTLFHCSCGRVFTANQIEHALGKNALLRDRLRQQIQAMDVAESSITSRSDDSFRDWLRSASYELGKLLGASAVAIKRLLDML